MFSDCCGAKMSGEMVDVGICPDCREHCEAVEEWEDDGCETVIDIVLRRTNRKWLGIVQIDGREVFRTADYHDTKEGALERADEWFKESSGGNLQALFEKITRPTNKEE